MSACVFVKDISGNELMPCSPRRSRLLLKSGSARIIGRKPFTIQLTYRTSNCTQPKKLTVGIDPGYSDIGLAVAKEQDVIIKATIELDNTESDNLKKRKGARVNRKSTKWYRKNKNTVNAIRKKRKAKNIKTYGLKVVPQYNFTAPSIQHRKEKHSYWIDKFLGVLPAGVNLTIELGTFDAHLIGNPDVSGIGYQYGPMYQWDNTKAYVRHRDNYTCQVCGAKNVPLHVHHIRYDSKTGTNKPDNLISVCLGCHTYENHQPGGALYQLMMDHIPNEKRTKQCDSMNKVNKYLKERYNPTETYGFVTKRKRMELGLAKTHYNDAFVIAGGRTDKCGVVYIKQHKTKCRQLHKMMPQPFKRPDKNTEQYRENWRNDSIVHRGFVWKKGDKVRVGNQTGYLTGISKTICYVSTIKGPHITKITKGGKVTNQLGYPSLTFMHRNQRWIYDYVNE